MMILTNKRLEHSNVVKSIFDTSTGIMYDFYYYGTRAEISIDRVGSEPDSQFTYNGQAAIDFWSMIEPYALDPTKGSIDPELIYHPGVPA